MNLFMVLFAVLVYNVATCKPETGEYDLRRSMRVSQTTAVLDGKDRLIGRRYVNLTVWGDLNKTRDNHAITNFVQNKLVFTEVQPEPIMLDYYTNDTYLPLQLNLTAKEVLQVGPKPPRMLALVLNVQIYCQRKHGDDVLTLLKDMKPSL